MPADGENQTADEVVGRIARGSIDREILVVLLVLAPSLSGRWSWHP